VGRIPTDGQAIGQLDDVFTSGEAKYSARAELEGFGKFCYPLLAIALDRQEVAIDGNIFDPDYFAYFEETDMCHRVWLAGYRIVYAHKSVIFHKMGATSSSMNNTFIQYHSFKNRIRSHLKNFGALWLWTILPVHLLFCELYAIVSYVRGNWALGWSIERAYWWNIRNFSATLRQRKYVQTHIRRVSDSHIASHILKRPPLSYYRNLLWGRI